MSHVSKINGVIRSISGLKAACESLGLVFVEGKTTYKWYGRSVGDYPLPTGYVAQDLGKCIHAIRLPGCEYEIGVVPLRDPAGRIKEGQYTLLYDFWGPGKALKDTIGNTGGKLMAEYAVATTMQQAKLQGFTVTKTKKNGFVEIQCFK